MDRESDAVMQMVSAIKHTDFVFVRRALFLLSRAWSECCGRGILHSLE